MHSCTIQIYVISSMSPPCLPNVVNRVLGIDYGIHGIYGITGGDLGSRVFKIIVVVAIGIFDINHFTDVIIYALDLVFVGILVCTFSVHP